MPAESFNPKPLARVVPSVKPPSQPPVQSVSPLVVTRVSQEHDSVLEDPTLYRLAGELHQLDSRFRSRNVTKMCTLIEALRVYLEKVSFFGL